MEHDQVVCEIFGERDTQAIAKTRLITAVAKQNKLIRYLVQELYCENPNSMFFRQYSEEERKPLSDERIRRRVFNFIKPAEKHSKAEGRFNNTKRL